ncbi:hypothetical protein [Rossellomorea vietnamensis]|uniref:hypothetical protein n=1 Tax=Rossellomorea vietnamensis TaxID=218284 RepID=UPI0011E8E9D6|nr:hypothetical protein [Rossellomorea vietnamensis]
MRGNRNDPFISNLVIVLPGGLKGKPICRGFSNRILGVTAEQELPVPPQLLDKYKHYDTQMRFVLIDEDERSFEVERFCYLGGIGDWINIDNSTDLESLVREYVQHLGQESFYDLGV